MKRPFITAAFVLMLFLSLPSTELLGLEHLNGDSGHSNVLKNSGFEKGGSQPKHWTTHSGPSANVNFIWDHQVSNSGSRSVAILNRSDGPAMWRQTVPVKAGELYTFSGYVKLRRVKADAFCTLEVLFLDAAGKHLVKEHLLEHHGTIDWLFDIPHEKKFRAPPDAVSAEINLKSKGEGRAWFDDLFFGRTPLGSVEGTVVNGVAPVEGARVKVVGTTLEAITDKDGRYRIDGLPVESPRYVLIAKKNDFRSDAAGNVAVDPDKPARRDFVLRPGPGSRRTSCASSAAAWPGTAMCRPSRWIPWR